jgi:hypothetical protein
VTHGATTANGSCAVDALAAWRLPVKRQTPVKQQNPVKKRFPVTQCPCPDHT